jgi:hypothetical protein
MTRDVADFVIFFVVGFPAQIVIYRLSGGRWRDIYGKFWNPTWMGATAAAIGVGFLATWLGRVLVP